MRYLTQLFNKQNTLKIKDDSQKKIEFVQKLYTFPQKRFTNDKQHECVRDLNGF